jgi:hypothetical protein
VTSWWVDITPDEFATRVAGQQDRMRSSKFGQMNVKNLTIGPETGGGLRKTRKLDAQPDRTDDVD